MGELFIVSSFRFQGQGMSVGPSSLIPTEEMEGLCIMAADEFGITFYLKLIILLKYGIIYVNVTIDQ